MPYQTFDDVKGSSKSFEKLKNLHMTKDLTNKRCLDIGCNEGYFCFEMIKRGAKEVIGIDVSKESILSAKNRDTQNKVKFINQDWNDLHDLHLKGKFDLIISLSTLPYIENIKKFFENIYDLLTDDGLFILECGFINSEIPELVLVERAKSIRLFPTKKMLFDNYLVKFAPKLVSNSVNQSGDPINRYVIHCRKRKPILLLIYGDGGIGKTTLTRKLSELQDIQIIKTDSIFHFIRNMKNPKSEIEKDLKNLLINNNGSIRKSFDKLNKNQRQQLAELIIKHIQFNEELIIIEGYAIRDEIIDMIQDKMKTKTYIWDIHKSGS